MDDRQRALAVEIEDRRRACSEGAPNLEGLGGVESLVGHPRTMSHSRVPEDQKAALGLTENLVRLSVGIENIDDLIADLERGFAAC